MNFLVFYRANLLASLRVLLIRCDSYQHNTSYVFITDFESYAQFCYEVQYCYRSYKLYKGMRRGEAE